MKTNLIKILIGHKSQDTVIMFGNVYFQSLYDSKHKDKIKKLENTCC